MTCWGLFQEEPPQDMVRIVNDGSAQTLISYHRQVLKGWMISRKVYATLKPSDQAFQQSAAEVYPHHAGDA